VIQPKGTGEVTGHRQGWPWRSISSGWLCAVVRLVGHGVAQPGDLLAQRVDVGGGCRTGLGGFFTDLLDEPGDPAVKSQAAGPGRGRSP
jgi:hypothetical protein